MPFTKRDHHRPATSIVAAVEQSIESFRDGSLTRLRYRQILHEEDRSAAQALAKACGVPQPTYSFRGSEWTGPPAGSSDRTSRPDRANP